MIHISPRHFARPHRRADLAPSARRLHNLNIDVDRDGSVDIALQASISSGPAGARFYEVEVSEAPSSAGPWTVVSTFSSPTGTVAWKASTNKYFRSRCRAISWNSIPGTWSSYTAALKPTGQTGAPTDPTGISLISGPLSYLVSWTAPTELDFDYSEVRMGSAGAAPLSGGGTTKSSTLRLYDYLTTIAQFAWVRHFNTSGIASNWVRSSGAVTVDPIDNDMIEAGAVGDMDGQNHGTSGGSANAGTGSKTLLVATFVCSSTTSGVDVTLGSKTWPVDFKDGQPYTLSTVENGGGSHSLSKSGGGTWRNVTVNAVTLT